LPDVSAEIANEFWWSKLGFWILVVGLAGEILVLRVPKTHETLEKVLTLVFVIVIIVGVTFEHNADSTVAELISKQEMEAGVTIASLGRDAAASNARSLLLEKEAEELKSKNLSLEAKIAPRRLSPDQLTALKAAVRPFIGRTISIWSYGVDLEAGILANQIKFALQDAGAPVADSIGHMATSWTPHAGVEITGSDDKLMEALVTALKPISAVRGRPIDPEQAKTFIPAQIFVGVKPLGP
jgi:hypothetical protein